MNVELISSDKPGTGGRYRYGVSRVQVSCLLRGGRVKIVGSHMIELRSSSTLIVSGGKARAGIQLV